EWPPFKPPFRYRNRDHPKHRRHNKQEKQIVGPGEDQGERQEWPRFPFEKQVNRDNEENYCERRRLGHVHPKQKRRRTGEQRDEPHEGIAHTITNQQPVARENCQTTKERRRDLCTQTWI